MAVKLSNRLTALSEMVTPGNRLADVGTDHGYIPIHLCEHNRIPSAIAMDINVGPLERADAHIRENGLEERVETRLSDGLEKLMAGEADTILIAGMGGILIQKILTEGEHALPGVKEIILQPQSDIPGTRAYVREHGYVIADEEMIEEDGKFYPMMRVVPVELLQTRTETTEDEISTEMADQYGPILLRKKHPVLIRWIERELEITDRILTRLDSQPKQAEILARMEEMTAKQKSLQSALNFMSQAE